MKFANTIAKCAPMSSGCTKSSQLPRKITGMWHTMWKYDPVPVTPSYSPYQVSVEHGKSYLWCSCGHSTNQPWCDGSHVTEAPGFKPIIFAPSQTKKYMLCGCKHTNFPPMCNKHSHHTVRISANYPASLALIFSLCFCLGYFHNTFQHI